TLAVAVTVQLRLEPGVFPAGTAVDARAVVQHRAEASRRAEGFLRAEIKRVGPGIDGDSRVAQRGLAFDAHEGGGAQRQVVAGEHGARDAVAAQAIVMVAVGEHVIGLDFVAVETSFDTDVRARKRLSHRRSCGERKERSRGDNCELGIHYYFLRSSIT